MCIKISYFLLTTMPKKKQQIVRQNTCHQGPPVVCEFIGADKAMMFEVSLHMATPVTKAHQLYASSLGLIKQ